MTNNVLNIYKPTASAHETLYKRITNLDVSTNVNMVFAGASAGTFSYVLIMNGVESKNFKL